MDSAESIDRWAAPSTQLFAIIGLLWISIKILSFWRMIASLFFLPGVSVGLPMLRQPTLTIKALEIW